MFIFIKFENKLVTVNLTDNYFFSQKEPYQEIMLFVRSVILQVLPKVDQKYSYKIAFYNYHKKPMIYLNILRGENYVDVAFVQCVFS